MTNSKLLLKTIRDRGLKFKFVAEQLGLTANGFRKKANNQTEFKASEIQNCVAILHLSDEERNKIFFCQISD